MIPFRFWEIFSWDFTSSVFLEGKFEGDQFLFTLYLRSQATALNDVVTISKVSW